MYAENVCVLEDDTDISYVVNKLKARNNNEIIKIFVISQKWCLQIKFYRLKELSVFSFDTRNLSIAYRNFR